LLVQNSTYKIHVWFHIITTGIMFILTAEHLTWWTSSKGFSYGGVKRPRPTIHRRHVYKTRVTSTKQASRLQY